MHASFVVYSAFTDALFDLLMKMVVEPVPADNQLATGIYMYIHVCVVFVSL